MNYYLLEIKTDNSVFFLDKTQSGYEFQKTLNPSCMFVDNTDIISAISISKNLNQNYLVDSFIYELNFSNAIEKKKLNDDDLVKLEKSIISELFDIKENFNSFHFLFNDEHYNRLCNIHNSEEGNLLQHPINKKTQNAQLSFFKYIFDHLKNTDIKGSFIEIGTNKGFFGYIISKLFGNSTLYTIDINPESSKAVPILQDLGMNIQFNLGDSRSVLPNLDIKEDIILAWIDGGHEYDEAISDLNNIVRFKPKYIVVDDVKYFVGKVNTAYLYFLKSHPEYESFHNPFWDSDDGGIACCRLKD
jgi:hypothetical protein